MCLAEFFCHQMYFFSIFLDGQSLRIVVDLVVITIGRLDDIEMVSVVSSSQFITLLYIAFANPDRTKRFSYMYMDRVSHLLRLVTARGPLLYKSSMLLLRPSSAAKRDLKFQHNNVNNNNEGIMLKQAKDCHAFIKWK